MIAKEEYPSQRREVAIKGTPSPGTSNQTSSASNVTADMNLKKKFMYAPYDDTYLRKNKGYWVYASEAGNMTVKGAGGAKTSKSYKWSDLMFRNSSGSVKNISDAYDAHWISADTKADVVQRWDLTSGTFKSVSTSSSLSSWQGYFVYSNQNNITLLRQD